MRTRIIKYSRLWQMESRQTIRLALPIVAGMVGQMLMGITDAMMVGRVGVVPLAAATLVNALAQAPLVFGFGLLSSISVLTAQAFGAKRISEVGEVLRHGLILSAVLGIALALVLGSVLPVLGYLGQPDEVVAAAGTYLLIFGASLLPALVAQGGKQFSEAVKHPWAPTVIMLGAVLLNVLLNWILIYGHWGAPALGLEGAGWATLIARVMMAAAIWVYILRAEVLRAFQPLRWFASFRRHRFAALLQLGWPVGLQHLLEVGAFAFAAVMMGWISAEAIAAHQIAITCAATAFMFALGTGMAVCIRVGHAWGAAQFSRVRRIGFVGVSLGAGLMSLCGVLFMFFGSTIASWFVTSPSVINLAAQLLIVAAIFQIVDGIQVVSMSALRGLGDVRTPAMIAALAYWIIALPIGSALAFYAKMGAVGLWIGLATGLGSAACGLLGRFIIRTRRGTACPDCRSATAST